MNNRTLKSLVLALLSLLLGACDTMVQLPDKTWHGAHGAGNINHASTYVGRWTCEEDKDGKPIIGKCREVKTGEYIQGPSVAGQMAVAAVGGTGAALINGNTARAVAKIGKCPDGSLCGGTIVNATAIADAVARNSNRSNSNTNVGTAPKACTASDGNCTD